MKVVIIYTGSSGFPLGEAYTNRVLSISKGLVRIGCSVQLWILYPGKKSGVKTKTGVFDSVYYTYMTHRKTSAIPIIRKIIGAWGILNATTKILLNSKSIDCIITFTESSTINNPISIFSKLKGIIFLREINEFPATFLKKGPKNITEKENTKIRNSLKSFDGLICISHALKSYFQETHSYNKPLLIVPITVDFERFSGIQSNIRIKYITYCGYLFGNKDGIEILIKSFAKISGLYPDIKLRLIGNTDNPVEFSKILSLISNLNLVSQVEITGYVERGLMPSLLMESYILVLSRPDNLQAQGGFPTKLGEYLATGKPVITTSVGDIPKYLSEGVNAFLATPGNIESFAEKLTYVIENYALALRVAEKGKEVAEREFNGIKQAERIKDFINSIPISKT